MITRKLRRTVPTHHMCREHGMRPHVQIRAVPGSEARVTTSVALLVTLDCGHQRIYGVDWAWINSRLRMVAEGGFLNSRNELARKWPQAQR
jgi:phosphate-selective porin